MSHPGFRLVSIHQSLRAAEQRQKRAASLRSGKLDHGVHYLSARGAQLWTEVHRVHAPLFANPSFAEIFRSISRETAARLAGQAVHVIALGAGSGEKEAWLLQALKAAGCQIRYTPVDTSLELALMSAEAGEPYAAAEILPVAGDLSLLAELPAWLAQYGSDGTRIYTAYGLTPNFLPSQLFPNLAENLRREDQLLLSANLVPVRADDSTDAAYRQACNPILPQYDNPETRSWLRQILVDWGIADYLSEPAFSLAEHECILGFTARSTWLANASFAWEGTTFQAHCGEELQLFFSLRYTPARLAQVLKEFGLQLGSSYITPCGQEGVWQVSRFH
jgi:L-histidine N-alpha-methyltransferase